ncbi:MAG: class I SAM-dependent methyltransferase [Patescibacteria group bacterium]
MSHPLPPEFSTLKGKVLSSRVYPEFFALSGQERVLNIGCGDGPQIVVYQGAFASMLCVDIQEKRIRATERLAQALGIGERVTMLESNVERIDRPDASFDTVFAIDIIEHVEHPEALLREAFRLLVPGGRMLITFPALHDHFVDALSWLRRLFVRTPSDVKSDAWHPDAHQRELSVHAWRTLVEQAGFRCVKSRATTMFPPLHLYGIPRFWFANNTIHTIDRAIASLPWVQNLGQTVMVLCEKPRV